MGTSQDGEFLSDIEAHVNALVRREQETNKKLVLVELIMSRYKIMHNIAITFLGINDVKTAKETFMDQLSNSMHFQKSIIIIKDDNNASVDASHGYKPEELATINNNLKESIDYIDSIINKDAGTFNSIFVNEDKKIEEALSLSMLVIGSAPYQNKVIYILCGHDNKDGEYYKSKYPLSKEDTSWFVQLVVLWSSFLTRVQLFNEINSKANENKKLADDREKKIEERTRALLDALFEAKKYKLALELADVMVLLIDASSRKIVYANDLFERITGYQRDKIIGRKNVDMLNIIPLVGSDELFTEKFYKDIKEVSVIRGNYVMKTITDKEKEISMSISIFNEEGGGSIFVVIAKDITDERTALKRDREYAENIEKLNRLIINRELRIIELKKRIAQNK